MEAEVVCRRVFDDKKLRLPEPAAIGTPALLDATKQMKGTIPLTGEKADRCFQKISTDIIEITRMLIMKLQRPA